MNTGGMLELYNSYIYFIHGLMRNEVIELMNTL